jgi:dolichol kinase
MLDRRLLKQESERKLFHTAWAILPVIYYFGYPRDGMVLLSLSVFIIWCGFEISQKRGYRWLSADQLREHERDGRLTGTFFQVLSLFLAVLLFDRMTAVLAMLFCCVGDSVTGFAGALMYSLMDKSQIVIREYGRKLMPLRPATLGNDLLHAFRHKKSYPLMAIMFATCAILGMIAYPRAGLVVIAAGAAGAVIADGFAWRIFGLTLNDDLTITLASGSAIALTSLL